jgi:hypothetical protein
VALLPADPWFRPVWKDGDDASPPLPRRPPGRPDAQGPAPDGFAGVDFPALLGPLTAAQDAVARLDASAEAAMRPRLGAAATQSRKIPPRAIRALIARKWLFLRPAGPMFLQCSDVRRLEPQARVQLGSPVLRRYLAR